MSSIEEKRARLLAALTEPRALRTERTDASAQAESGIAIIGLAGRYPGAATLDQLWGLLSRGESAIREVPSERWDARHFAEEHGCYARWGGFLDAIDRFDPELFGISAREAVAMDPQERLFLETCWCALEHAGHTRASLAEVGSVGVFAGVMNGQYGHFGVEARLRGQRVEAFSDYHAIANRVSYCFDFRGPSLAVDTACSSSLTAIHLACESLRRGECEAALAGGVNLIVHPLHYQRLCAMRMLSAGDACRSFSADADGFVDGEGVGVVLLTPLSRAIARGDRILAVIRGSAINGGGKTSGYTVPNPIAQAELVAQALRVAGVEPDSIDYVEAHGTGTVLGDPIEVAALDRAFGSTRAPGSRAIGSIKSNIGHLESAAGVAGLTKVVLQLQHQSLVPSIHAEQLNPKIAFERSSFALQRTFAPWSAPTDAQGRPRARRAGVSSFGAGGANAHVVIEGWSQPEHVVTRDGPWLILLSAKNRERLQAHAQRLHDALPDLAGSRTEAELLSSLAYSLQVGREPLEQRAALIVDDVQCLRRGLMTLARGESSDDVRTSRVQSSSRVQPATSSGSARSASEMASAWLSGEAIDWRRPIGEQPALIDLPHYPFAGQRLWAGDSNFPSLALASPLHPLIDRLALAASRVSDGLTFQKHWRADDPLVAQHRVEGIPTVPAAAYIEMALACASQAGLAHTGLAAIRLVRPIQLQASREVSLKLSAHDPAQFAICCGDDPTPHVTGQISREANGPIATLDVAAVVARCPTQVDGDELYRRFAAASVEHGESFRLLQTLRVGASEVLATLLPSATAELGPYRVSPTLLDAALQAAGPLLSSSADTTLLPHAIERVELRDSLAGVRYVYVHRAAQHRFDLALLDAGGRSLLVLRGLEVRPYRAQGRRSQEQSAEPTAPAANGDSRPVYLPLLRDAAPLEMSEPAHEGDVLVVDGGGPLTRALVDRLAGLGASVLRVRSGAQDLPAELARHAPGRAIRSVLLVPADRGRAASPRALAEQEAAGAHELLALIHGLVALGYADRRLDWKVVARGVCGDVADFAGATTFGIAHTAAREFSRWRVVCIDLDELGLADVEASAERVLREPATRAGREVVFRAGRRLQRELIAQPLPRAARSVLDGDGTLLITGGAGGVGFELSKQLAKRGRVRLAWLGRRALDERIGAQMAAIEALGSQVAYWSVDLTDGSALRATLDAAKRKFGPIRAVLHSALVLRDKTLARMSEAELREVLAPKLEGSVALLEALADTPLECIALFSSLISFTHAAGQGNYAAASRFLDSFGAVLRESAPWPVLTFDWGYWGDLGGAAGAEQRERFASVGVEPLRAGEAVELLIDVIAAGHGQSALVRLTDRARGALAEGGLRTIAGRAQDEAPNQERPRHVEPYLHPLAGPELAAPPAMQRGSSARNAELEVHLRTVIAEALRMDPSALDPAREFAELGVDSLVVLNINERLERDFGELPGSLLYEYSSIGALASYLAREREERLQAVLGAGATSQPEQLFGGAPAARRESPLTREGGGLHETAAASDDIAVIGVAGRYPGARNPAELWSLLAEGRQAIREVPRERWDRDAYGEKTAKFGGFIDDADRFDALFFHISPKEAARMDPQERLFLEVSWASLEDAGYTRERLREDGRVGVFVGVMNSHYELCGAEAFGRGQPSDALASHWSIANRVSYCLDLHGPSLAVDTACSSSLTAIHLACESLRRGDCSAALAGGVNLILHPLHFLRMSAMQMLASDDRCKSFGAEADGFVDGEGLGCLLLKPLAAALRDGDRIHALIKGTAINHGGKTGGFTVPNPRAQAEVVARALRDAAIEVESLGYIEAHGTGTALGDPIEISGLTRAFREFTALRGFCAIGSIKSNIGHLESAAGVVGLTKLIAMMQHGELVPTLHCEPVNPKIDFANSPFVLQQTRAAWPVPASGRRRGGVSSFGAGGANAHVILEEWPGAKATERGGFLPLFPISARDQEALRARIEQLLALVEGGDAPALPDIAYTLQAGREHMELRVIVIAEQLPELRERLREARAGRFGARVIRGEERSSVATLLDASTDVLALSERWRREARWERLAQAWAAGLDVPWRALQPSGNVVSLPTYPFAGDRHWLPSEAAPAENPRARAFRLDNTSSFGAQRFALSLDASAALLRDHLVRGRPTLPGAALIEIVRAAAHASGGEIDEIVRLRWLRPLEVESDGSAELRLVPFAGGATVELGMPASEGRFERFLDAEVRYLDGSGSRARPPCVVLGATDPTSEIAGAACYARFAAHGLVHGPSLQALVGLRVDGARVLARLALPEGARQQGEEWQLPPALIDAAMLASAALLPESELGADLLLPSGIEGLRCFAPLPSRCLVELKLQHSEPGALAASLQIADDHGEVCLQLDRLELARVASPASLDLLTFTPDWRPAPLAPAPARVETTLVLVGVEQALAQALGARVEPRRLRGLSHDGELAPLLAQLGDVTDLTVILQAPRVDATDAAAIERGWLAAVASVRALVQSRQHRRVRVLDLCRLGPDDAPPAARLALTEFGRSVELEDGRLALRTVLLADGADPGVVAELLLREAVDSATGSATIRYRGDQREQRGLREQSGEPAREAAALRRGGVYVISGGLGGLGRVFARELAARWAARVILCGRSRASRASDDLLGQLRSLGAEAAEYHPVDVADASAVRAWFAQVVRTHGTVHGVIHAAGVARDGLLVNKTDASIREVLAAKLHGTLAIDAASAALPLDFFALFSSFVGVAGNAGQSDYALANGFLDHWASEREALSARGVRHGRTIAFAWPAWAVDGMATSTAVARELSAAGLVPLGDSDGVRAFTRGLAAGSPQQVVIYGDAERLRRAWRAREQASYAVRARSDERTATEPQVVLAVKRLLKEAIAQQLELPMERLREHEPLDRYGIDSVMIVEVTRALERRLGSLPKTLFFEHRTIAELADVLAAGPRARELVADAASSVSPVSVPELSPTRAVSAVGARANPAEDGFAIIGIAGRYPGAADLDAFWRNLREGRDSVEEVPSARWDHARWFAPGRVPGKTNSKWGAFLEDADCFDAAFFSVTPREAEIVDPQERIFLETVWHLLEDAGTTRARLRGATVGVYVGVMYGQYELMTAGMPAPDGSVSGSSHASIANRVSYFFDFSGPSLAIDTMCSSSLSAVHLAISALRSGECDVAVAGGVNLAPHPHKYLLLGQGRFLSSEGRCRAFGAGGDGYVPGEGVGAVLLKPLSRALADGDRIHAVIKASAINHGGKTHGYTVPNPSAQTKVVQRALECAGWEPDSVGYVEAHGTGTALGDPIEVAALTRAFASTSGTSALRAIGSVKTNIGHLESAAGVAGLTKVVLQLRHRQLVPSLHASPPNEAIDFGGSFAVQQTLAAWPVLRDHRQRELPRRAGISSFGAGGSNAHVLIEEWRSEPPPSLARRPELLLASAKSEERLHALLRSLLAFARLQLVSEAPVSLRDAAYTLQLGREALTWRAAWVTDDWAGVVAELEAWLAKAVSAVRAGRSGEPDASSFDPYEAWSTGALAALGERWVGGLEIDWSRVRAADRARPCSLPLHPFARTRYWIDPRLTASEGGRPDLAELAPEASPRSAAQTDAGSNADVSKEESLGQTHLFETLWVEQALPASGARRGPVLLICDDAQQALTWGRWFAEQLDAQSFLIALQGPGFARLEAGRFRVDLRSAEAVDALLDDLRAEGRQLERIVFLAASPLAAGASLDIAQIRARLERGPYALVELTKRVMARQSGARLRLVHAFVESEHALPVEPALAGLFRSLRWENAHFAYSSVALGEAPNESTARAILAELGHDVDPDPEVRLEAGRRYVRRARAHTPSAAVLPLRERGAYLITGGVSGLGLIVAGHLAQRYRARLTLVSRSAPTRAAEQEIERMRALGAQVSHVRADIATHEGAQAAVTAARASFGSIDGVVHAAMVLRDGFVLNKPIEHFEQVLAPKLYGTILLERALAAESLDFFAMFSSMAGAIGQVLQADYAFASAFQDHFARVRERARLAGRAHGITRTIDWCLWAEGGTATGTKGLQALSRERFGWTELPTQAGLRVFEQALRSRAPQLIVSHGLARLPGSLCADVAVAAAREVPTQAASIAQETAREPSLPAGDEGDLEHRTIGYLTRLMANATKLEPAAIEAERSFADYGFDSIVAVQFVVELEQDLGSLPKTLLLEHTSLRALARHLLADHGSALRRVLALAPVQSRRTAPPPSPSAGASARREAPTRAAFDEPIAIIGMAARFPGARNIEEYWRNLEVGRVAIREVPPERWDAARYYHADLAQSAAGKIACRVGGFIDEVDRFDPLFFNMTPAAADLANPEDRLALEQVWSALEHAAIAPSSLAGARVGVFFGMTTNTYPLLGVRYGERFNEASLDGAHYSLANRISHLFDFVGPSVTLDTACSSSMVALHAACQSLRAGESSLAIVGAANLYLHPAKYLSLCKGRLISASGRAGMYRVGADGFIPGEGVAAVVLAPLSQALAAGHPICGVIRGIGFSHKGKGAGALLPSPPAQARLISEVLQRAGIAPESLDAVEVQAYGGEVADLAEWRGLLAAFEARSARPGSIALSSVKPNIGHLEATSGLSQLIKVLLQFRERRLAPVVLDQINPAFDLASSPFFIPRELSPWSDAGQALRASINGFGAGGTQVHVVVESAPPAPQTPARSGRELVVLSNRTGAGLDAQVGELLAHLTALRARAAAPSLRDLAHTLASGRDEHRERLALVVRDLGELEAALGEHLAGRANPGKVWRASAGSARADGPVTLIPNTVEELPEVAGRWVHGARLDTRELRRDQPALRIALPTYVFERRRCWLEPGQASAASPVATYYDQLAEHFDDPRDAAGHILLAPFPAVRPGFSAVRALAAPDRYPEDHRYVVERQRALRARLFDMVAPSGATRMLDIGCGVGSDLVELARRHPQLNAHGYNISERQVERCRRSILAAGLDQRVEVFCRDSARDEFPAQYDLVIGFEVACHIEDKRGLFGNVARHLTAHGKVVLADMVACTTADVRMPEIGQFTATESNLAELLAESGLQIREVVDASQDIANFLYDPDFEANLAAMHAEAPALVQGQHEHRGWYRFGLALREGLFRYVLLTLERGDPTRGDELTAQNRAALASARRFSDGSTVQPRALAATPALAGVSRSSAELLDVVAEIACAALRLERHEIDVDQPFSEMGVDSLQGLRMLDQLNRTLGLELQVEALYDQPTLRRLARFVASKQQVPVKLVAQPVASDDRIAVVGMAGRFPGAPDTDALWRNLAAGVDSVSEIPKARWDVASVYDPNGGAQRSRGKWGGFLDEVDRFDPMFFKISPRDANYIDPQQRLFLESCWHALEDAGYAGDGLNGARCGCVAGVVNDDYRGMIDTRSAPVARAMLGNASSLLAARLAYFLDLRGAATTIDTGCSSSLVAVHMACQALLRNEADLMLAGGVTLYLNELPYILMSHAGMISPTGRCRGFDESADGIAPGEAVAVVVLKRLSDAIAAGDHIHGVIRASGVNQDGRTNGITAPSAESQCELQLEVYRRAGVSADRISMVEAHGTGTPLGDPIEVAALTRAFREHGAGVGSCALGTIKSNIGHTSAAGGAAALIKVLLAMRHRQIPASLHFQRANPHLRLDASPFFVNTRLRDWQPKGTTRLAAVSSYGWSGTNSHVLVEEYVPEPRPELERELCVVPLSARDDAALQRLAAALRARLQSADARPRLADVAFTLQLGRLHLARRHAFVTDDLSELIEGLTRLAASAGEGEGFSGRAATRSEAPAVPATASTRAEANALARAWVNGQSIDWAPLHRGRDRRRVPLPGYPFERLRCWFDVESEAEATDAAVSAEIAAPTTATLAEVQGADPVGDWFALGRWEPSTCSPEPVQPADDGWVLVVHPPEWPELVQAVRSWHSAEGEQAEVVGVALGNRQRRESAGIEIDARELGAWEQVIADVLSSVASPNIRAIYFLTGLFGAAPPDDSLSELERARDLGPLALLQLVRALLGRGMLGSRRECRLRVATQNVQRVRANDASRSHYAGLFGMCRSLCAEVPGLSVSCVDLDWRDLASGADIAKIAAWLRPIHDETRQRTGGDVAVREGRRLERMLRPLALPAAPVPCRQNGVYVLIGGTGGVGVELAHHLAQRYRARLVIVGRRPLDARLRAAFDAMRSAGGEVMHAQLDAGDASALGALLEDVRRRFGQIHGVFQSALVFKTQALEQIGDDDFRAVYAGKLRTTHALCRVLSDQPLDFVAFFSSMLAMFGAERQAHYAAASTWFDAFALSLRGRRPWPIHVINWGFWDVNEVGPESRARLAGQGVYFMDRAAGSAAVERALAHRTSPLLCVAADQEGQRFLGLDPDQRLRPAELSPIIDLAEFLPPEREPERRSELEGFRTANEKVERMCEALLLTTFQRMGVLLQPGERHDRAALRVRMRIAASFTGHFDVLLRILVVGGFIQIVGEQIVVTAAVAAPHVQGWLEEPESRRDRLLQEHEQASAAIKLAWACLARLPEVLRGEVPATQVLFPNSSTALVEGVYRGNPVTDYFNGIAAAAVVSYVRAHLARQPAGKKLRILEIGAGTGGTSGYVFEALAGHAEQVHYTFTDVSRAFELLGRANFGARYPFVEFGVLDIERPPATQGFASESYDIVIAANVLHATRRIEDTLRRVDELLRPGGVLVLYELTQLQAVMSLTFGLMDGWRLAEDADQRIVGSPLLTVAMWEQLFARIGWSESALYGRCVADERGCTQAVFVAQKSPWRRLEQAVPESARATRTQPEAPAPHMRAPRTGRRAPSHTGSLSLAERVSGCIVQVLQLAGKDYDLDLPFAEMGVDSILAVDLINHLNEQLGIRLRGTDMFNLPTPRALCDYVVERHPELAAPASEPPSVSAQPAPSPAPNTAPSEPSAAHAPSGVNGHDLADAELLDMLRRLGSGRATILDVEQVLAKR